jgi:hypothetical protein
MGIIHGFENSWGPWMLLEEDQPGLEYLLHARRFVNEIIPFSTMRPDQSLLQPADYPAGHKPRVLSAPARDVIAVYFPAGGDAVLNIAGSFQSAWFDPRSGQLSEWKSGTSAPQLKITAPAGQDGQGHPVDAVLVLKKD